ncbi:MAG: glutaredoxin 3 [Steroidobacterales bacterium]
MNRRTILMFAKAWCPYCDRARALLQSKNLSFDEIDIEARPEQREEMIRRTGRRTVPQIFIGERHVGGSEELHELDASGGLEPLLRGGSR